MVEKKSVKSEQGIEFGLIGFIFGILSIVFIANNGIIISVIGFIFSIVQHKKKQTKFSKWGIILNIIGFVLSVILIVFALLYLAPLLEQQELLSK